jgi:REP element-mobilizing transposase RayT
MARKPRIIYPGALYHAILRGNNGQTIFFDDKDRTRFCFLIQEGVEHFGHRVHSFCLMANHVHLAIQISDIPLSRIMQNLSFRYTRWVNWRQKRSGHLFQGRYKAVLIDADNYLQELTRYIHLNPVRVGIVKEPEDYEWSGHRAYLGFETIPWLTTDWVLSQFSKRLSLARRAYGNFVHKGKGGTHQEEYHRGSGIDNRVLGDDDFIDRVVGRKPTRLRLKASIDRIMLEICRHFHLEEKDFFVTGKDRKLSEARGMAGWLVMELGGCPLEELGKRTGRDVTTLSSGVKRLQIRSQSDLKLADSMKLLLKAVS